MKPILTNVLSILMAASLLSGYACKSDGGLAAAGSGGDLQTASGGSGGTSATSATSGIPATGGTTTTGGFVATGGLMATGGALATGGTTANTSVPIGSGGIDSNACSGAYYGGFNCGGTTGSAGAPGTGGGAGTCNIGSRCDAAPTACSCETGTTTWDCYCRGIDCSKTLAAYTAAGGAKYDVRMEYANCNLVEYWTLGYPSLIDVFDLATGQLVGQTQAPFYCPFTGAESDAAPNTTFSAGRVPSQHLPDSTCVRSKCSVTSSISDMCVSIDAGPPKGN